MRFSLYILTSIPVLLLETSVIKCAPMSETVDLCIDYEDKSLTYEKRKAIEHTVFLSNQSFDSYSLSDEVLFGTIEFI